MSHTASTARRQCRAGSAHWRRPALATHKGRVVGQGNATRRIGRATELCRIGLWCRAAMLSCRAKTERNGNVSLVRAREKSVSEGWVVFKATSRRDTDWRCVVGWVEDENSDKT